MYQILIGTELNRAATAPLRSPFRKQIFQRLGTLNCQVYAKRAGPFAAKRESPAGITQPQTTAAAAVSFSSVLIPLTSMSIVSARTRSVVL